MARRAHFFLSSLKPGVVASFAPRKLAIAIGCLALAGCFSSASSVGLRAEGDAHLNRSESGKPLSLEVRVYQLKSLQALTRMASDQLAAGKTDAELLGSDLLDVKDVIVLPNEAMDIKFTLHKDATHVAVAGLFRRPDPQFWRVVFNAHEVRREGLRFVARQCALEPVSPAWVQLPGQPAAPPAICPGR